MPIMLVGLNHCTAPVELRERLSLSGGRLRMALEELQIHNWPCQRGRAQTQTAEYIPARLHEGVILSTCNRMEIYAVAESTVSGRTELEHFLARLQGVPPEHLSRYLYFLEGRAAVEHLMQVAAGLDSMILGEPQILGQVAQAFHEARAAKALGPILSHLFTQAIRAGKRARSETAISRHTTSVGHVATLLAGEKVGHLRDARALVVGAGAMAKLAARALRMHDIQAIACINRTDVNAEALARQVQGRALSWGRLPEGLAWADVVITATGAPHTIIHVSDVVQALPQRHGRPLVFVDIAVPRDVEEGVGNLPGIYRYDIDDLQVVLNANLAQRQAAVPAVEAIVNDEAENFWRWLHNRQIVPVITDLRCKALALVDAELAQAWRRLEGVDRRSQQTIARLAYRIVNKLLHEPTVRLKARAANDYGYAQVVRELFALNTPDETPGQAPTAADHAPMDVPSQTPRSVLPCPSGGVSDD